MRNVTKCSIDTAPPYRHKINHHTNAYSHSAKAQQTYCNLYRKFIKVVMNGNVSAWIFQAKQILTKLDGAIEADKKKATILALARAKITGATKGSVFKQSRTGSQTIYYEKWKDQDLFAKVEKAVMALVSDAMEEAELAAIRQAMFIQRMAAPDAARKQVELLDAQQAIFYEGEEVAIVNDNGTQRLAAKELLAAASIETAPKSTRETNHSLTAETLDKLTQQAKAELDDWKPHYERPEEDS